MPVQYTHDHSENIQREFQCYTCPSKNRISNTIWCNPYFSPLVFYLAYFFYSSQGEKEITIKKNLVDVTNAAKTSKRNFLAGSKEASEKVIFLRLG